MIDKSPWESMATSTGRLQFLRDIKDGDFYNPYKKGTPEWYGYEYEKNHYKASQNFKSFEVIS